MVVDRFVKLLEEEQASVANIVLLQTDTSDLYKCGRAAGVYAGLNWAKTQFQNMLAEEDEARNK